MRVFLTGGSGFLGRHLVRALSARGDECVVVTRRPDVTFGDSGVRVVAGDPRRPGPWTREVAGADVVVNLAGQTIVDPPKRWTPATRRALMESRMSTTAVLVDAIRQAATPPRMLLSASAIGYYGARGDDVMDESQPAGTDFLAQLALAWEAAARGAATACPVALLRTGMVLGRDGGVLSRLLMPFRLGLGGPWGNGRQWWSWIHVRDWVSLVCWIVDRRLDGPVNMVAPDPVTVNDFAVHLGRALGRPALLRIPAFALRLGLGAAAGALLDLPRVTPRRALQSGYRFEYVALDAALADITGSPHR